MASFSERFLWSFYIVHPNNTTFEHEEEVPSYIQQMVPMFVTLIILEDLISYMKRGKILRLNDGLTSISQGMMMELTKLLTAGIDLWGYLWVYERRLLDLDWQSPWTWLTAAVGVDFCYYWVHRAAHEISLFWSGHQVHHSSEEYNLFTALRQSGLQQIFSFGFYHPLALLGVPLPAVLVHFQFSLIYQFWIHTEFVSSIGPLEWIFNTPSHHRVHHGINKWCLDKNYAGVLIIWDRMFGTFQPERKDEAIVYGLVSQPQTFEPFTLQLYYLRDVLKKTMSMPKYEEKMKALFFGPGWNPGTPRLGDEAAIPEKTQPRPKYNPTVSVWLQVYLLVHFITVVVTQQYIMSHYATLKWFTALIFIGFVFFSLFTVGIAFDNRWWSPLLEVLRCVLTLAILRRNAITESSLANNAFFLYFTLSSIFWSIRSLSIFKFKSKKM